MLHPDNGAPRAGAALDLARALGIILSYSRPRGSDDAPYSESLSKTAKYDPDGPPRSQELHYARNYMHGFFARQQQPLPAERTELPHPRHRPSRTGRTGAQPTTTNPRSPPRPQAHCTRNPTGGRNQPQRKRPAVANSLTRTGITAERRPSCLPVSKQRNPLQASLPQRPPVPHRRGKAEPEESSALT